MHLQFFQDLWKLQKHVSEIAKHPTVNQFITCLWWIMKLHRKTSQESHMNHLSIQPRVFLWREDQVSHVVSTGWNSVPMVIIHSESKDTLQRWQQYDCLLIADSKDWMALFTFCSIAKDPIVCSVHIFIFSSREWSYGKPGMRSTCLGKTELASISDKAYARYLKRGWTGTPHFTDKGASKTSEKQN